MGYEMKIQEIKNRDKQKEDEHYAKRFPAIKSFCDFIRRGFAAI